MGFHDECGVTGIFGAENAAGLSYFALTSLQHRGQESAGIAVSNGLNDESNKKIILHKGIGLVGEVFKQSDFEKLKGSIAVGHVRYATAGGRTIDNAQPFLNTFKNGSIALAHNGQLVNHTELREMLEDYGSTFSSTSDSEVILKLIVRKFIENGGHLGRSVKEELNQNLFIEAVKQTAQLIKGSFALCIMTENMLIGVRDPYGIRPLCLGKLGDASMASYIIASESCAIDSVNGTFLRDIAPGEIVVINKEGVRELSYSQAQKQTCIFEYVYFARPDSVIDGIAVQQARYKMGEILAQESGLKADVVIGVPDSGIGAAQGYAMASGIPYVTGIIKNKYIGRTFIAPTQAEREAMVFVKLNAIKSDLEGKRVVSSPPVKFPCHLGIDTPSKNELISSTHELEEIRAEIGADSLAFISLEGMIKALQSCCKGGAHGWCHGCFNGEYPV